MDTEKQRQCRRDEQLLGAYRVTDQQRMAARRALEWIGALEAWLIFRYEISDLFAIEEVDYSRLTAILEPFLN